MGGRAGGRAVRPYRFYIAIPRLLHQVLAEMDAEVRPRLSSVLVQ
jgi:hypothetical protein